MCVVAKVIPMMYNNSIKEEKTTMANKVLKSKKGKCKKNEVADKNDPKQHRV